MISLKKSFIYKDLCYLMILWSVKLPIALNTMAMMDDFDLESFIDRLNLRINWII